MNIETMFNLDEKTALITGGAGGIGFACARALATFGANVILADVLDEEIGVCVKNIEAMGRRALGAHCDVSNCDDVEKLIGNAQKFGGIDIFINSAAVTDRKQILEMTHEEWRKIIDINLNGAFNIGKAVAKQMVQQNREGKMIFIVSTGAYCAAINFGAYSASKAGVVMLMKTLALELAPYSICVNAIVPTATDTHFTADYYAQHPDKKADTIRNHPLGRIAVPEDYMGTAIYLASSASNYMTGSLVVVDGGKTAK